MLVSNLNAGGSDLFRCAIFANLTDFLLKSVPVKVFQEEKPDKTPTSVIAMNKSNRYSLASKATAALATALMLLLVGCASTKYGAANINSTPEGAEIVNLKDNTNLGMTPAQVVWRGKESEKVTIQLQKKGYHSAITSFWVNKRHKSEAAARENAIDVHSELSKE